MASAGFACELFSNNPRWDSDVEQDDMPSVIWDEGGQDKLDQHGLRKKLALGADNLVSEDRVYAEQQQVPIQISAVWDSDELFDERSANW
jgi:hypothetical protein